MTGASPSRRQPETGRFVNEDARLLPRPKRVGQEIRSNPLAQSVVLHVTHDPDRQMDFVGICGFQGR